jgi:hypothetical protein
MKNYTNEKPNLFEKKNATQNVNDLFYESFLYHTNETIRLFILVAFSRSKKLRFFISGI